MGRYPQKIDIEQSLGSIEPETLYSVGVPLELINNRPDVAASEYSLVAANARVGVAESLKYPSLTINGTLGLSSLKLENFLDPVGSGFAILNGAIFQPIFQNREIKTNYKIALAERQIAKLDFKDKFITAVEEISNSLTSVEKEKYAIAQERIEVAQKGVDNASMLFKSGLATYLEVLTAQSNALDSELNLTSVKMQILIANVESYRNLGGGWQ